MEAPQYLPIKRHTSLLRRLPETRFASELDKSKASWVVFGHYLAPQHFDDMDAYTGTYNPILATWKVGHYEVALMAGELTAAHQTILHQLQLDCAPLAEVADLSKPGLIVMDMDSTLIQMECIDEIAKLAGVGDKVSAITERAMQGELDFEQSLRERVATLKGADADILEQVRANIPFMPDLESMLNTFHAFGWKTAIASGGFTYFSDYLKDSFDIDEALSNTLEICDGKLTGKVVGEVVSAQTKADILYELAERYDVESYNTVAIGDGANDLVMLSTAGFGIAYHAKPTVVAQAQASLHFTGLGGVLCILSGVLAKQQKISWQAKP